MLLSVGTRIPANIQELHQVIVLTMDIAYYHDRILQVYEISVIFYITQRQLIYLLASNTTS